MRPKVHLRSEALIDAKDVLSEISTTRGLELFYVDLICALKKEMVSGCEAKRVAVRWQKISWEIRVSDAASFIIAMFIFLRGG